MSDMINEQLSALADDELPRGEFPLLWQRVARDPELTARWARYHLVRDALRGDLPTRVAPEIGRSVTAALAGEAPVAVRIGWARRVAGPAVAAAVAAVALLTLQVEEPAGPSEALVVPVTANPQVDAGRFATASGFQWDQAQPEVQTELDRYLLNHTDDAVSTDEVTRNEAPR
ncbi:MAG: sigma-E factor negative regulatory protein [Gammaproteobacteria bacterium]